MTTEAAWRRTYERFDPEQPAEAAMRVDRPYSRADKIAKNLARGFGDRHFLLTGSVGTGKSTELLRIAGRLAAAEAVAVIDLHAHFEHRLGDDEALQHVRNWEVLFLVGLAVHRLGAQHLGHAWDQQHEDRFRHAVADLVQPTEGTSIDLTALGQGLAIVVGGAVGAAAAGPAGILAGVTAARPAGDLLKHLAAITDTPWAVKLGLRNGRELEDQDERVQRLVNAVNQLVDDLADARRIRLTVFVDGLDRVKERDTAEAIFTRSALLDRLRCGLVVTGPLLLRRDGRMADVRGFRDCPLANLPVVEKSVATGPRPLIDLGPIPDGTVVFFADMVRRRLQAESLPTTFVPPETLAVLVRGSAGRSREFVRLCRDALLNAYDRDPDTSAVSVADAEQAVDDWRRTVESGIHEGHLRVLGVAVGEPRTLPDDALTVELLENHWLLPYDNESEWYFPHALLFRQKLPLPIG